MNKYLVLFLKISISANNVSHRLSERAGAMYSRIQDTYFINNNTAPIYNIQNIRTKKAKKSILSSAGRYVKTHPDQCFLGTIIVGLSYKVLQKSDHIERSSENNKSQIPQTVPNTIASSVNQSAKSSAPVSGSASSSTVTIKLNTISSKDFQDKYKPIQSLSFNLHELLDQHAEFNKEFLHMYSYNGLRDPSDRQVCANYQIRYSELLTLMVKHQLINIPLTFHNIILSSKNEQNNAEYVLFPTFMNVLKENVIFTYDELKEALIYSNFTVHILDIQEVNTKQNIGISNSGNDCYANTAMQAMIAILLSNPELTKTLLEYYPADSHISINIPLPKIQQQTTVKSMQSKNTRNKKDAQSSNNTASEQVDFTKLESENTAFFANSQRTILLCIDFLRAHICKIKYNVDWNKEFLPKYTRYSCINVMDYYRKQIQQLQYKDEEQHDSVEFFEYIYSALNRHAAVKNFIGLSQNGTYKHSLTKNAQTNEYELKIVEFEQSGNVSISELDITKPDSKPAASLIPYESSGKLLDINNIFVLKKSLPYKTNPIWNFPDTFSVQTSNGVLYYTLHAAIAHSGSNKSGHYLLLKRETKGIRFYNDGDTTDFVNLPNHQQAFCVSSEKACTNKAYVDILRIDNRNMHAITLLIYKRV